MFHHPDTTDESGFTSACDCPDGECACFAEGYAAGKDKSHFEIRALAEGLPHRTGCGCAPCITIRAVVAAQGAGHVAPD